MNVYQRTVRLGDKDVLLEVGRFSEQADAAVLASCGGTVVHATVAVGGESNLGYFPLQVEYVEKFFAGGRIKGSRWVKHHVQLRDAWENPRDPSRQRRTEACCSGGCSSAALHLPCRQWFEPSREIREW